MNVDYACNFSNHFPLLVALNEYCWSQQMQDCRSERPLMLNNLHLHKPLFQDYVDSILHWVQTLNCSPPKKMGYFGTHNAKRNQTM